MGEGVFEESTHRLLMVYLLLMFWGALRFSDLQRVEVWSMELQGDVVRGHCWKLKPRPEAGRGAACAMAYTALGCRRMRDCDFLVLDPLGRVLLSHM